MYVLSMYLVRTYQTWVKCVNALDSNTFQCTIDLAWCSPANQEEEEGGSHGFMGSNKPDLEKIERYFNQKQLGI